MANMNLHLKNTALLLAIVSMSVAVLVKTNLVNPEDTKYIVNTNLLIAMIFFVKVFLYIRKELKKLNGSWFVKNSSIGVFIVLKNLIKNAPFPYSIISTLLIVVSLVLFFEYVHVSWSMGQPFESKHATMGSAVSAYFYAFVIAIYASQAQLEKQENEKQS